MPSVVQHFTRESFRNYQVNGLIKWLAFECSLSGNYLSTGDFLVALEKQQRLLFDMDAMCRKFIFRMLSNSHNSRKLKSNICAKWRVRLNSFNNHISKRTKNYRNNSGEMSEYLALKSDKTHKSKLIENENGTEKASIKSKRILSVSVACFPLSLPLSLSSNIYLFCKLEI